MTYDSTHDTQDHIERVGDFMDTAIQNLKKRAETHDASKLQDPEKETWDRVTPLLKDLEYGTEEYRASLREIKPAIQHHYRENDHHPEHYSEGGIGAMSMLALIEMLCDWRAASERSKQSMSFMESLEYNRDRYEIPEPLFIVLVNTAAELGLL